MCCLFFSISIVFAFFCYLCPFCLVLFFFFFKQKTAYERRISYWSSDVCSSDLPTRQSPRRQWRRYSWMQPLAEQGVVEAQYQMAFLLCLGDGVTKNEDACMAGWGKQPGRATPKPSTVTVACCRKKRPRRDRTSVV